MELCKKSDIMPKQINYVKKNCQKKLTKLPQLKIGLFIKNQVSSKI